jgi:hypothetical protein
MILDRFGGAFLILKMGNGFGIKTTHTSWIGRRRAAPRGRLHQQGEGGFEGVGADSFKEYGRM